MRAGTLLLSARLSLGEGRRVCKQRCPPRDYESHAAYCQGKGGPSSLLGSSSASSRCLFGFNDFTAYRNMVLGAQRAPVRLAGMSGWATPCAPRCLA